MKKIIAPALVLATAVFAFQAPANAQIVGNRLVEDRAQEILTASHTECQSNDRYAGVRYDESKIIDRAAFSVLHHTWGIVRSFGAYPFADCERVEELVQLLETSNVPTH